MILTRSMYGRGKGAQPPAVCPNHVHITPLELTNTIPFLDYSCSTCPLFSWLFVCYYVWSIYSNHIHPSFQMRPIPFLGTGNFLVQEIHLIWEGPKTALLSSNKTPTTISQPTDFSSRGHYPIGHSFPLLVYYLFWAPFITMSYQNTFL